MKLELNIKLLESLLTLGTVIEARDAYTGGHTWRVSQYAAILGNEAGLNKSHIFALLVGGLVHDLGKVGIPDSILSKKGPLDDREYAIMKKHPEIGSSVIENHPLAPLVQAAVTQHHERIDGRGYPETLEEEQLGTTGRIMAIADAFDAMTSTRPYRKGMLPEKAYNIIEENMGTQFDEALGKKFIQAGKAGKLNHILGHAAHDRLMLSCPACGPIIAPPKNTKSGDHIFCPSCTGDFVTHQAHETFELEWQGTTSGIYIPAADHETVEDLVAQAPKKLEI